MSKKKICQSKCWLCKNATDLERCIWVRTLKIKPKGSITNENGFIVECPNFEKVDTRSK